MNMTDRLIREGDPPAGQPACPVPQYQKADGTFERVRGQDGGVYSVILGADGNPISSGNPWPVQLNGSIANALKRRFAGINRVWVITDIAANTLEVVHTYTSGGADIEFLDFSTDVENHVGLEIEGYQPDGQTAGTIYIIGAGADTPKSLTPAQLRIHKSSLFELLVDDAGSNMYKIGVRRQVPFGNGFKISVRNTDEAASHRYGLFVYYNKDALLS